jgi:hypothetical protein
MVHYFSYMVIELPEYIGRSWAWKEMKAEGRLRRRWFCGCSGLDMKLNARGRDVLGQERGIRFKEKTMYIPALFYSHVKG